MAFLRQLLILIISIHAVYSFAKVKPTLLSKTALENANRVPEFEFIREIAQEMNIKIYLFGGSAAAYAHYVRWDIERLNGDQKHQPERFDYDFTNIYRGNQDLDLVVDGTAEQAQQVQSLLMQEYPHFVGNKESWEVRLLRDSIGDKLPLLDDPDFQNQHTDTNSTGVLDLTAAPGEIAFKDLLDWDNPNSQFLKDVSNAKITYIFNPHHSETSRFKEGKNPPIFSAIRYLAKLTQYEVKGTDKDLKIIQEIIDTTNFDYLSGYVKYKLSEFAKKTLLNSPNSEYAWDLMDQLGLREKLISMDDNNINTFDSLSWWLNKEPLRTSPLGRTGKKAKDIFGEEDIIVSHETNSFLAYENITRSSRGEANAFISRNNVTGEAAVHGNGFYTQVGQQGARGTGLTIRFKLHPNARAGKDFTYSGSYVVVKNKKALKLIQENININIIDFFKLINSGDINHNDRGLKEKFVRKFNRISSSSEEFKEAVEFVKNELFFIDLLPQEIQDKVNSFSFNENFSELMQFYIYLTRDLYHDDISYSIRNNPDVWFDRPDILKFIIEKDKNTTDIIQHILRTKKGLEYEDLVFEILKKNPNHARNLFLFVFSTHHWFSKHFDFIANYIKTEADNIIADYNFIDHLVKYIFNEPEWSKAPQVILHFFDRMIELEVDKNIIYDFIEKIFVKKSFWTQHAKKIENLYSKLDETYATYFFTMLSADLSWTKHPGFMLKVLKDMTNSSEKSRVLDFIFINPEWMKHKKIIDFFIKSSETNYSNILTLLSNQDFSSSHVYLIEQILSKKPEGFMQARNKPALSLNILSKEEWVNYPKILDLLLNLNDEDLNQHFIRDTLKEKHWQPFIKKVLDFVIQNNEDNYYDILEFLDQNDLVGQNEAFDYVLTIASDGCCSDFISRSKFIHQESHPKYMKLINFLFDSTDVVTWSNLAQHILWKKEWSKKPELIESILDKEMPRYYNGVHLDSSFLIHLFSKPHWIKHTHLVKKIIERLNKIEVGQRYRDGIETGFREGFFNTEESKKYPDLMISFIESSSQIFPLVNTVISKSPFWLNNTEVIESIIEHTDPDSNEFIAYHVFTHAQWEYNKSLVEKLYTKTKSKQFIFEMFHEKGFFEKHPDLFKFTISHIKKPPTGMMGFLKSTFLPDKLTTFIINNILKNVSLNPSPELLVSFLEARLTTSLTAGNIISLPYWQSHPDLISYLDYESITVKNILSKNEKVDFLSWMNTRRGNSSPKSCQNLLAVQ